MVATLAACGAPPGRARLHVQDAHPWPQLGGPGGDGAARGAALRGEVAWSVALGARVDASPLVTADGAVVVVTRAGEVVLLDAARGAVRRRRTLTRAGGGAVALWATPALVGDVLVLAAPGLGLVGLDAVTLAERWRGPRRFVAIRSAGAARADGARAWLCAGDHLVAVDAGTGAVVVDHLVGDRCYGAPGLAPGGGVVVASRDGGVTRVDRDGRVRWRAVTSPGADNDSGVTVTSDLVVLGSNDGHVHAFDLTTGTRRWEQGRPGWVVSTPASEPGGDTFFVGDDGDGLSALAGATGAERWRARTGGDVASSPLIVGGLVVHGSHDGTLRAWDAATGAARWQVALGAAAFASPARTAAGWVVIATHAGEIVAVR
jgi:outer membrane protein assembly factor BamB